MDREHTEGLEGPQGAPSEVTAAQLDAAVSDALTAAVASSSSNTNAVETLETPFADPDLEVLRLKLNEMLLAARR